MSRTLPSPVSFTRARYNRRPIVRFVVAQPFGFVNSRFHIFDAPLNLDLTQSLKIRFDLAFQHSHRAANPSQRWATRPASAFRLYRPLAHAKNPFQFEDNRISRSLNSFCGGSSSVLPFPSLFILSHSISSFKIAIPVKFSLRFVGAPSPPSPLPPAVKTYPVAGSHGQIVLLISHLPIPLVFRVGVGKFRASTASFAVLVHLPPPLV